MRRYVRHLILGLALLAARSAGAQQMVDYSTATEPLPLLVREPAVLEALKLSADQTAKLQRFNEQLDPKLLALRNKPAEEAQAGLAEVIRATDAELRSLLSPSQRDRLDQIARQVRGLPGLLTPDMDGALGLTPQQRQSIEAALAEYDSGAQSLRQRLLQGEDRAALVREFVALRQRQQKEILEVLSADQQSRLGKLFGESFPAAELGKLKFRAPELIGGPWIHSPPTRLADLRGKVVAVHFYAFGCINCQRNFPWYHKWYEAYAQKGLEIVAIHTPETEAERNVASVRDKANEAEFKFPVLVDNDHQNWDAWGNSLWPTVYLIDKNGYIRYWWFGELNWSGADGERRMRACIEQLLAEG